MTHMRNAMRLAYGWRMRRALLASNATYERTYGTYERTGHLEILPLR